MGVYVRDSTTPNLSLNEISNKNYNYSVVWNICCQVEQIRNFFNLIFV